jgi:hypothetical protein
MHHDLRAAWCYHTSPRRIFTDFTGRPAAQALATMRAERRFLQTTICDIK